jgi:hypothetical protein
VRQMMQVNGLLEKGGGKLLRNPVALLHGTTAPIEKIAYICYEEVEVAIIIFILSKDADLSSIFQDS